MAGDDTHEIWHKATNLLQLRSAESKRFAEKDSRQGHFIALTSPPIDRIKSNLKPEDGPQPLLPRLGEWESAGLGIYHVDFWPTMLHLTEALDSSTDHTFAHLAIATEGIDHELHISHSVTRSPAIAVTMAAHVIYLLRAKAGYFARAVAIADHSWNTIAGLRRCVHAARMNDEWHQQAQWESTALTPSDALWAFGRTVDSIELHKHPGFRLAFDATGDVPFIRDLRLGIARAWAGIEGIVAINAELRNRLAMYLAVLLSDNLDGRLAVRDHVRKLYDLRSRAVHGGVIEEGKLKSAAVATWRLLADVVVSLIELDEPLPGPDRFDQALFGKPFVRKKPLPGTISQSSANY